MNMPKVSIVMPIYNGEKYLRESIESILSQTFQNWELWLVNDCSTDSSPQIIKEYMEMSTKIHMISNLKNLKLPRSLNIGFQHARGEYLTWTSDDNRYKPDALETMVRTLDQNPRAGMVYCNMEYIHEDGSVSLPHFNHGFRWLYVENTIGACFMYRRKVLETIGEYNPDMFLVEDYDYWLRISKVYEIHHISKNLYQYRLHKNSLTSKKQQQVLDQLFRLQLQNLSFLLERTGADERSVLFLSMWIRGGNDIWKQRERFFPGGALPQNLKWMESLIQNGNQPDKQKQLILFGAGDLGKRALKYYGGKRIYAFVDNNESLHGKSIEGVPIISFGQMKKKCTDYQIVISVGCKIAISIGQQLEQAGIKNYVLYTGI